MGNMKVSLKLFAGFGIVILLTLVLGGVSIYHMRELTSFTEGLYDRPYTVVTSLREADTNIVAIHRSMKDVALAKTSADIEAAMSSIANNEKTIAEKLALAKERYAGDKGEIAQIEAALADWKATRQQTVAMSRAGEKEKAALLTQNEGNQKMQKVNADMEKVIAFAQKKAQEFYDNAEQTQARILSLTVGIIAVVVFVSALTAWMISREITNKIDRILDVCKKIAVGDLRSTVNVHSRDELGQLAAASNQMIDNVKKLIAQIQRTSEQVASSSEELTASADQSAQITQSIARSIEDVSTASTGQAGAANDASAAVQEMSAGIEETAATVASAAQQAHQALQAAEHGNTEIERAVRQMNNIETTVNRSAQVVAKLGERSKEIGQIVDTIAGIAGQTNLLALNAAIEAARAGEMGKGFAVVAEEVRKLAEQSQEAAKQIGELIGEIQGDTEQAVVAMDEGTKEVQTGTQVVQEAGGSFGKILETVNAVYSQANDIAKTMEEVANGTQQIVGSVQEIDHSSKRVATQAQSVSAATEEQSASMEEIAASSRGLAQMAQDLMKMSNQFRV